MWVDYGRAYFQTSMSLQKQCKDTNSILKVHQNY